MNVFCYPRITGRVEVLRLLGIEAVARPEFGVRANLAMRRGEVDRTELDMCVGDLIVEAKLTEGAFARAPRERVLRYLAAEEVFEIDALDSSSAGICGYQLIRGVLAAQLLGRRYLLLCDERRSDLREAWFRVLGAVRSSEVRSRLAFLSWQELAGSLPPALRKFLLEKYAIAAV